VGELRGFWFEFFELVETRLTPFPLDYWKALVSQLFSKNDRTEGLGLDLGGF
jgi:hypothetical protein